MNFIAFLASLLLSFTLNTTAMAAPANEAIEIVPNEKVCMVTDAVFPKKQIPVTANGKTYYGCCENCKKTLSEDAKVRSAVDPISGKSVDKASAVIAAREDGSVIYFENKKNFEEFKKQMKK